MPKNCKITKKDNVTYKQNVASKLRIGNRKTGVSAMLMSVAALKEVLSNTNKKRYHSKARNALHTRGIEA